MRVDVVGGWFCIMPLVMELTHVQAIVNLSSQTSLWRFAFADLEYDHLERAVSISCPNVDLSGAFR